MRCLWESFRNWISDKDFQAPNLQYNDITFGVLIEDKKKLMMYNSLIIIAKQFVHSSRFINARPLFFTSWRIKFKSLNF